MLRGVEYYCSIYAAKAQVQLILGLVYRILIDTSLVDGQELVVVTEPQISRQLRELADAIFPHDERLAFYRTDCILMEKTL